MENISFLIVDESAHMVSVLKVLLRAFGVRQIEECYDGNKAYDAFQAARPGIIVLSANLSRVPSLELVRRFRDAKNSSNPFVPIILVTTDTNAASLARARDAGVTEMVRKPVGAAELQCAIDAIVHHPRPFVSAPAYFGPCRRRGDADYHGVERRQIQLPHAAVAAKFAPAFPPPASRALESATAK